jgi:hypothetical protein
MRSLLAKIAIRKAVGLYLGEHEIAVSEVSATPLGPVETASRIEPCSPSELISVLERTLQSLPGRKGRRLSVAIGLPSARIFFGSRPLQGIADPTPVAVLQKLLCSSNIAVDDLTVDLIRSTANKMPLASVAACRKKYMAAVLAVLERCGCEVLHAEPAPCALVRVAARQYRSPRRSKMILRVFLGATEGLAVLMMAGIPLGWRPFALSPGMESMAVVSASRTLSSQSKFHGIELGLDYVMIHGRTDIHARLQKEGLPTELGARVIWSDGPAADGATTAYGLALGCLNENAATFDLARLMKPPASLRGIFPWGELACQAAILLLMGLILSHQSGQLTAACAAARAECNRNKILASATTAELTNEKRVLTQKITAIQCFLGSRIPWTAYTRDMTSLLPANVRLLQISGASPFAAGNSRGGGKKNVFTMAAESPLAADGTVPREIGDLLVSLRRHPLLVRDFPKVQLTGVKQGQAKSAKGAGAASFSIVCQPGAGGASGKKAGK